MRGFANRFLSAIALAALLAGALPGTAGAAGATPSGVAFTKWGWVTVRSTATGTYTPAPADRGNSAHKINVVKHPSAGTYSVIFKGIGNSGGVPLVSVLGNAGRVCMVSGWGGASNSADEQVDIHCYTTAGISSPARFTLSYFSTTIDHGPMAYLYSAGVTGDATPQYSYNSVGFNPNHIDRTGAGQYTVTLPGVGTTGGNVQVSARFAPLTTASVAPAGVNPATCKVTEWKPIGDDEIVSVECVESHGAAVDSEFTLSYGSGQGLKGHGRGNVAYLWADKPHSASYHPHATYRYNSSGASATITRQGAGRYTALLAGMPSGGSVQLTSYGSDATRCVLGSIARSGTQRVAIRCVNFSGAPTDAYFSLSYER